MLDQHTAKKRTGLVKDTHVVIPDFYMQANDIFSTMEPILDKAWVSESTSEASQPRVERKPCALWRSGSLAPGDQAHQRRPNHVAAECRWCRLRHAFEAKVTRPTVSARNCRYLTMCETRSGAGEFLE